MHPEEYLKHKNMRLDYWTSFECYVPTPHGNNSSQSMGDDSDGEIQEVAPKRAKTAEQSLDEQPDNSFEKMLTAKVKERLAGLSQDDFVNYSILVDVADQLCSESAVAYLRTKPARKSNSTIREVLMSGVDFLENLDYGQVAKILFAAILVGEQMLIKYQDALEELSNAKKFPAQ